MQIGQKRPGDPFAVRFGHFRLESDVADAAIRAPIAL